MKVFESKNPKYQTKKYQKNVVSTNGIANIQIIYTFFTKRNIRIAIEFLITERNVVKISWYRCNRLLEYLSPIKIWNDEVIVLYEIYNNTINKFLSEYPNYKKFELE